jgi:hypothetical protein
MAGLVPAIHRTVTDKPLMETQPPSIQPKRGGCGAMDGRDKPGRDDWDYVRRA